MRKLNALKFDDKNIENIKKFIQYQELPKTFSDLESYENNYNEQVTLTSGSGDGSVANIKLTEMSIGSKTIRCDSASDDENIKLYPIEDNLETKNELLQQKLDELQKLQMQLSNF